MILVDEGEKQLLIRQGITAERDQFNVAGVSTFMMSRAIIRTTKPGSAVLGNILAWDGYTIPPAFEGRSLQTKPREVSWQKYIEQTFKNPKEDVGVIFVTSPDSLTGQQTDPEVLKDLLAVAEKYNIRVVLNQVHATPNYDGSLPEPQTSIITNSCCKNLVVLASVTKQLMSYASPGMEKQQLNIFYSPNPALVAEVSHEIEKGSTAPQNPMMINPASLAPAVDMLKASDKDFYVRNQKASYERRLIVDQWLQNHPGVEWYYGTMPQTGYHASLTFKHELLEKAGITSPHQLYDYILFSTGLDFAPVFDQGPENSKNDQGDVSVRMNYSMPKHDLGLSLALLDVAVEKLRHGVTLDQIRRKSLRLEEVAPDPKLEYAFT